MRANFSDDPYHKFLCEEGLAISIGTCLKIGLIGLIKGVVQSKIDLYKINFLYC